MSQPERDEYAAVTQSPEETIGLGYRLARGLRAGDLVLLEGELGAGKTRLVKGIASGLGIDPHGVSSPTFVLSHEYPVNADRFHQIEALVHIDAYRIGSLEDLESIGWTRGSERPDSEFRRQVVTVIEWPSKMRLPDSVPCVSIRIEHVDEQTRRLRIEARPATDRPRIIDAVRGA